jgi:hypothetical protein
MMRSTLELRNQVTWLNGRHPKIPFAVVDPDDFTITPCKDLQTKLWNPADIDWRVNGKESCNASEV